MGAMKILIVEDEVEYGWLLAKFLREKGYLTEHVASGKSAIEHLESQHYDLILLDLFLPDMNGMELLKRLKELTGIELKVIAPEEEGRYAFLSVAYSLRPNGRFCIIDQGGGSTEFVCGRGFQVESLRSLPFGIVNLTEEFIHSDPPKLYELESLKNFLDEQIKEVVEPCDQLIGLGGTITTIAAIEYGIYPYKGEEVHGKELSIDKIMFWIETLSSMKEKDRIANFPHIEPKRAKVIIPGLLIFYRSMLLFGKDKIKVSDWGLKEGLLVEEVIKK